MMDQLKILLSAAFLLSFQTAIYAQDEASVKVAEIQKMANDTNKVLAWIDMCNSFRVNDFELAENYADSAIVLAESIDFKKGLARAQSLKGRAALNQSKFDIAEENFKAALKFYSETNQLTEKALELSHLGILKQDIGEFDQAMTYQFQALDLYEDLADTVGVANCFINIAVVYAIQTNLEKAEFYFLKALEIYKQLGNQGRMNTIMLNLGGMRHEKGNYEEAIEIVTEAQISINEIGPPTELARSHYILGNIYLSLDKLDIAEKNYLISKEIFDSIGSVMRSTGCLLRLSSVLEKQGNYPKAIAYAEESLELNKEYGILNMLQRSLYQLANLHEAQENYKDALFYRKELATIKDSLVTTETNKQIVELEKKYQSELKDRQLAQARAELERNELILQKQQNEKYALMGVAGFILIIFLLLFNQYYIKKRNNDTLRGKNAIIEKSLADKEVLLKEIHHRVKNNLQFISSLLNLQARHISDPQTLAVLTEGKNRVLSMALVHQKLYQEENLKGVQMRDYVENLVDGLVHSYKIDRNAIAVNVDVDDVYLDIDFAMPAGMILNELITNAFKYAFAEGDSGTIDVCFKKVDSNYFLSVSDKGKGFPDTFNIEELDSFGFKLIKSLAEKLKAEVKTRNQEGAFVEISFPNNQNNLENV